MFGLFLLQALVLFMILIFLQFIKRFYFANAPLKIKAMDIVPFFALWYLHNLTVNASGFSIVPYVVMFWILLGAVILIIEVFILHRFKYGRFYVNFWRIGDLYLLLIWIIVGVCYL